MNEGRGGLLSAGGILSVLVGAFQVLGGGFVVAGSMLGCLPLGMWFGPCRPGLEGAPPAGLLPGACFASSMSLIAGGTLLVLGIVAIAGGVSALKRRSFGLALAGAICSLPSIVLGVLAVIFVSLGKGEFEAG